MSSKKSKVPILAMADILRDLAVLRANDVDLNQLHETASQDELDESVEKAWELSKEARAALKVQNQQLVENEGKRIDELRARLEEVVSGLSKAAE
jgi:post-segregation antitoxin (ccd killing protein)